MFHLQLHMNLELLRQYELFLMKRSKTMYKWVHTKEKWTSLSKFYMTTVAIFWSLAQTDIFKALLICTTMRVPCHTFSILYEELLNNQNITKLTGTRVRLSDFDPPFLL